MEVFKHHQTPLTLIESFRKNRVEKKIDMSGVIQGVRRTHGQPTEEPRGNDGELFQAILRFAEHLRENHGGTTENPFG